jgi:hypothetical protein
VAWVWAKVEADRTTTRNDNAVHEKQRRKKLDRRKVDMTTSVDISIRESSQHAGFKLLVPSVSDRVNLYRFRAPSIRFFLANGWESTNLKERNQAVRAPALQPRPDLPPKFKPPHQQALIAIGRQLEAIRRSKAVL